MTIDDLLIELEESEWRFWFIQRSEIERTDEAIRLRLIISTTLFIQVFLSEATGRFSLALIQGRERLYGRDREGGMWHCIHSMRQRHIARHRRGFHHVFSCSSLPRSKSCCLRMN